MRLSRLLLIAIVTLPIVACGGSSPRDLLIGKWQAADDTGAGTMEFARDGTLQGNRGFLALKGKYQWQDDKTVHVELENPAAALAKNPAETTIKLKYEIVAIDRNELVAKDAASGATLKFKRVK